MEMWKTAAHAAGKGIHWPMEMASLPTGQRISFPQLCYSGSLRTFPQRLLRLPIPIRFYPNENMKKTDVRPIGQTERLYAHFYAWQKVYKTCLFLPYIRNRPSTKEIINALMENTGTEDYSAVFPPISIHFWARLEL